MGGCGYPRRLEITNAEFQGSSGQWRFYTDSGLNEAAPTAQQRLAAGNRRQRAAVRVDLAESSINGRFGKRAWPRQRKRLRLPSPTDFDSESIGRQGRNRVPVARRHLGYSAPTWASRMLRWKWRRPAARR